MGDDVVTVHEHVGLIRLVLVNLVVATANNGVFKAGAPVDGEIVPGLGHFISQVQWVCVVFNAVALGIAVVYLVVAEDHLSPVGKVVLVSMHAVSVEVP